MGSPQIEVVTFFDIGTGAPLTGLSPTFLTYENDLGANVVTHPAITEIGGGAYKFTPVFGDPNRAIFYMMDGGGGAAPRYQFRFMRPEDWNTDQIPALGTSLARALGLMHENSVLDQTVFDGGNNLTAARFRIYDSKAHALAAGGTGLIATYTVTATYLGGNLQTYSVVLEP